MSNFNLKKFPIGMLFLIWVAFSNANADTCYFDSDYKIKTPDPKESQPFGDLLEKMKIPEKDIQNITSKYFTGNSQISSVNDVSGDCFDISDSNNELKFRIVSIQNLNGSSWDHIYFVFKKFSDGWLFLKDSPISQINDSTAIKIFNFQHHLFLALVNVQDHGYGLDGWTAIANYDLYLMDNGMEYVGSLAAYGNPGTYIIGRLDYETMDIKNSDGKNCYLESDLKFDFDAVYGGTTVEDKEKYEFDEFKAFSKKVRLFYKWDEASKKLIFNSQLSDFIIDPANLDTYDFSDDNFLVLFYPELEKIAEEKDKNKNIWLMSTLDFVKSADPKIAELKQNLLKEMSQK
jgi:hypothetical protein